MPRTKTAPHKYVRLGFADGEIIVTPKDRDIFLISAEKAVEACRNAVRDEERINTFEAEMLLPLHEWCRMRADKVRACYIPLPGAHIQVFIVTNSPEFDFDLAEEIALLERELAQRGWRVGVLQLPDADEESLATFFRPDGALEVYAQRGPAPQ